MSTIIRLRRSQDDEDVIVFNPNNFIIGQPFIKINESKPSYQYICSNIDDENKIIEYTRYGSDLTAGGGLYIDNKDVVYNDGGGYKAYVLFRTIEVKVAAPLHFNANNQIALNIGTGLSIVNGQLVATGGSGSSYEEGLNIEIDNDDLIHSFRQVSVGLSSPAPQFTDGSYNLIGANTTLGLTPTFDKVSTYMALKVVSLIERRTLIINLFNNLNDDSLIQEGVIHHINIFNGSPEVFKIYLRSVTTDVNFKMIDITSGSTFAPVDNTIYASGKTFHLAQSINPCYPNTMVELSFIKYKDVDGHTIISITHT